MNLSTFGFLGLSAPEYIVIFIIVLPLIAMIEVVRRLLWGFIFKQCRQPLWKAWVPVLDLWTIFKLGRFPGWLAVVAYVSVLVTIALSIVASDSLQWYHWLLGVFVIAIAIISLIAVYRINIRLGLHGAFILVYLFGGEIAWLIAANIWKSTTSNPS